MMPAFAVAAENRQSGIRLLSVADAARPGGAREVPPAQPVLALFLRGCKQPNLSSVDFGCKISCLLRSGQARGWLLAMEAVQTPPQTTHSVIICGAITILSARLALRATFSPFSLPFSSHTLLLPESRYWLALNRKTYQFF